MFYTIYKITNQINGKIYIGSHKTKDLDDDYMGSGKYLKLAQEKYGLEHFSKEILFVFDTPGEMYAKEAEIVCEDFLVQENTYNLKVGGRGGWDAVNADEINRRTKNQKARQIANANGAQQKANLRHRLAREAYEANPSYCHCCKCALPYKIRRNKYCSRSCAAKINNIGVVRNKKK